jgi:hypothetical protein
MTTQTQIDLIEAERHLEYLHVLWSSSPDYWEEGPIWAEREMLWVEQSAMIVRTPPKTLAECAVKLRFLLNQGYEVDGSGQPHPDDPDERRKR